MQDVSKEAALHIANDFSRQNLIETIGPRHQ